MSRLLTRRRVLTGLAAPFVLAGCDRLGQAPAFREMVLSSGEWLSHRVHRLLVGDALAREYPPEAMSPDFRTNGNTRPRSATWQRQAERRFTDWRLRVGGLVEAPRDVSLAQLRAMPARSQITRHDCVEGWSAIGKWTGVPLGTVLDSVRLRPEARYIVFRCADDFSGMPYYESLDLRDAFHPQTILAYGMNDADLPLGHGAPLRLRVERQLGYKHAKFLTGVEAVASLSGIGRGQGGFWEDAGFYEWYAGI
ncbi:Oxidoreductase molybdopterin binding domain-containing protein [Tranquillimonas rosea]|uniref:Oxidoreductase molybdopterin binding domain-containing protein n=1 Tax=Tranquillimonas rosea TaxID=641238 RepID=A0A1H9W7W9_9RHOB|nr:molybdopterin-dependent oxidoreductase [Tranquillimonas rosea]SES29924.1 Oxidoreductase molybdopterin binding domain-containing protein [Tranquillimonas rosea]